MIMANPLFRKNMNGGNNGNNYSPQPNGGRMGGRPPSKFDQIRQIIGLAKARKDPQALLNMMFENNPEAAQQFQAFLKSGRNPKEFVTEFCKNNNIDLEELLRMVGLN